MNYITTYLRKIISRGYYSTIHSHGWIVLFCAVILGRYYTDWNDVDEDMVTASILGGWWAFWDLEGVMHRHMADPRDTTDVTVASKK